MPDTTKDLIIKRNDTWPPVRFTLGDIHGPVDLSTALGVKLLMKGNTILVTGMCTVDADQVANKGKGSYAWAVGDTALTDEYTLEFEVTWGDGTVTTFPNDKYQTVEIQDDLG